MPVEQHSRKALVNKPYPVHLPFGPGLSFPLAFCPITTLQLLACVDHIVCPSPAPEWNYLEDRPLTILIPSSEELLRLY